MQRWVVTLLIAALGGCAAEMRAVEADRLFSQGCYHHAGEHIDAAARAYRESLALRPSSASANNLGVIHARRGDLDGARVWFTEALRIDEHDFIARTNLGVVLYHLGSGGPAVETLLSARRQRRDTLDRLPSGGRVSWDADRYAAATAQADDIAARYLDRLMTGTLAPQRDDGLRLAHSVLVSPTL